MLYPDLLIQQGCVSWEIVQKDILFKAMARKLLLQLHGSRNKIWETEFSFTTSQRIVIQFLWSSLRTPFVLICRYIIRFNLFVNVWRSETDYPAASHVDCFLLIIYCPINQCLWIFLKKRKAEGRNYHMKLMPHRNPESNIIRTTLNYLYQMFIGRSGSNCSVFYFE